MHPRIGQSPPPSVPLERADQAWHFDPSQGAAVVAIAAAIFGVARKIIAWMFSTYRDTKERDQLLQDLATVPAMLADVKSLAEASAEASSANSLALHTLMDRDSVARFSLTAEGACIAANVALCSLLRVDSGVIQGGSIFTFVAPEDRQEAMTAWELSHSEGMTYRQQVRLIAGKKKVLALVTISPYSVGKIVKGWHGIAEVVQESE